MSKSHLSRVGFAFLFIMLSLGLSAIPARASSTSGAGDCVAHHFTTNAEYPIWYTAGCTGHDEPELDPVSALPGSAQDLTWTAVLPEDGTVPVSSVGPTFWWGGTVTDPNTRALFGQAFLEVQFYPDGVVKNCTPGGGFNLTYVPNAFSVCSPVWQVNSKTFAETAAFNAMLVDASTGSAMVMHGGDTITIHFYMVTATDGWHITVQDLTSGHQGTIILDSQYGPLQPAFSTQQIGNSLGWGIVHDTPNAFVWEIGHTSPFTNPSSQFCTPGQTICDSYDAAHWAGFTPLQIKAVTFADGSTAQEWATVSDFGGSAEVNQDCTSYGGPFCIYPWFSSTGTAFNYGVDYSDTQFDYGQADQFAPTEQCSGPLGPTYCDTVIHPTI